MRQERPGDAKRDESRQRLLALCVTVTAGREQAPLLPSSELARELLRRARRAVCSQGDTHKELRKRAQGAKQARSRSHASALAQHSRLPARAVLLMGKLPRRASDTHGGWVVVVVVIVVAGWDGGYALCITWPACGKQRHQAVALVQNCPVCLQLLPSLFLAPPAHSLTITRLAAPLT